MSNLRNEDELVGAARSGDLDAFWTLVERHGPMVRGLLRRLVQNRERAEDLFSETFLRAADRISGFRGESKFSTWLVTIALNLARNELKRDRRRRTLSWDDVVPAEAHTHGEGGPALAEWRDPHSLLEARELEDLLDRGLRQLPAAYRMVFVLRDIEGLSTQETASVLKLSESAVKSRAVRARLALRKFLSPYFNTQEPSRSRA